MTPHIWRGSLGLAELAPPKAQTPFTAWMNAFIFAWSFLPGELSTPLETSTPNGRTLRTAPATFSGVRPPARKIGFPELLRLDGEVPVEFFARAAADFRRIRVEQPGVGRVFRQFCERSGVADAEGLHVHQAELRAEFRRLVAVKLKHAQPASGDGAPDLLPPARPRTRRRG